MWPAILYIKIKRGKYITFLCIFMKNGGKRKISERASRQPRFFFCALWDVERWKKGKAYIFLSLSLLAIFFVSLPTYFLGGKSVPRPFWKVAMLHINAYCVVVSSFCFGLLFTKEKLSDLRTKEEKMKNTYVSLCPMCTAPTGATCTVRPKQFASFQNVSKKEVLEIKFGLVSHQIFLKVDDVWLWCWWKMYVCI